MEGLSENAIKNDVISMKWTRNDTILGPDCSDLYYASDENYRNTNKRIKEQVDI